LISTPSRICSDTTVTQPGERFTDRSQAIGPVSQRAKPENSESPDRALLRFTAHSDAASICSLLAALISRTLFKAAAENGFGRIHSPSLSLHPST
jgi:hypothetical protein